MPGKISQEKIEQIRSATDIVDVVSQYLTLTQKGKNLWGLCPFHQEKTPSFSVNPEKQIFYCFGCKKGGDVYTFLMDHEKLSFIETIRLLAQKKGIPLEIDPAEANQFQEKEALYSVSRFAARFFYTTLANPQQGLVGLKYFASRGLTAQTIKKFGLGFSPNDWVALFRAATKQSYTPEMLLKAGLIIPRKDNSGFYDRFRNRIIFPIFDASNRVVAFGGRRMVEENSPKYINSPETPIYQKRETLYGLAQTRQAIQTEKQALLVEGYLDLISLFQHGIQNAVASSGTALTDEHAKLISRYTQNIVLLFDGDSAGSRAALKGLDILLAHDLDVHVTRLPAGDDPDSFVRTKGADALRELIRTASPLVEFKVQMVAETEDLQSPTGKTRAIHSILESVIQIKDEIKQAMTIREVATRFLLDERLVLRELEQMQKSPRRPRLETPATPSPRIPENKAPKNRANRHEIALTKLLIRNPGMNSFVFLNLDLNKIRHPVLREIIEIIYVMYQENRTLDRVRLMSYFQNPEISAFIARTLNEPAELPGDLQEASDILTKIEARVIEETRQELSLKIRAFEKQKLDTTDLERQVDELKRLEIDVLDKKFLKYPKKT